MKKILLVRPLEQANPLKEKFGAQAFDCTVFPSIEIKAISFSKKELAPLFKKAIHKIIFTSANAVRFAPDILFENVASSKIIAIGEGTKASLKMRGIEDVIIPEGYSSEGLLALVDLQVVRGEKIFILTGKNPRALLKETLEKRGAEVQEILCYERTCPQYSEEDILKIVQHSFDTIISYSLESLKNLEIIFANHLNWLKSQQFLVVTQAMQEYCIQQGFLKKCLLAENVSDDTVIEALATARKT